MRHSTRYVKEAFKNKHESLLDLQQAFIMEHVPRLHRLLMERFPHLKAWFDYKIAGNEEDPRKLTLLKGKKVIARNFNFNADA